MPPFEATYFTRSSTTSLRPPSCVERMMLSSVVFVVSTEPVSPSPGSADEHARASAPLTNNPHLLNFILLPPRRGAHPNPHPPTFECGNEEILRTSFRICR